MEPRIIAVSGGFDPIHVGHLRMIQESQKIFEIDWHLNGDTCRDRVCVILNSDDWLIRKKGYAFMSFEERKELIEGYGCRVMAVDDSDGTVVKALKELMPYAFANGGDRTSNNTPEIEFCQTNGIKLAWNIGFGGKVQSSSELVARSREYERREDTDIERVSIEFKDRL
jgi:D-beta-D-heptose 7-phosphate kinase/D-beta-D-heptose 1-phosphate adenosyltransferase